MKFPDMANDLAEVIERFTGFYWPPVSLDLMIQEEAFKFEDRRGFYPNINYDGPEKFEVEDAVLSHFGIDPTWRQGDTDY